MRNTQPLNKFGHAIRVVFGTLVLFAMLGNCSGRREASVIMMCIIVLMWGATKIVLEAIESYVFLTVPRLVEKSSPKPEDEDEEPPRPTPPTAAA